MSKTTKNSRHSNKEKSNGWTTPKSNRQRNTLIKIFVPKSQETSTTASVQNPGDQASNNSQISTPIGNKEIAFSNPSPSTQEKFPITPDNQSKKNIDFVPLKLDLNEKEHCSDLDSNRENGITPQEVESKKSESFPSSTRNNEIVEEEKTPEPVKEVEKKEEPVVIQEEKKEEPVKQVIVEQVKKIEQSIVEQVKKVEPVIIEYEKRVERETERIIEKEVEQNLRKSIEAVLPKMKPEENVKKSSVPPPSQEEKVKEKQVKSRPPELLLEIEKAAALSTQLTHDDLSAERNKEKEKEKEKKFVVPQKKSKEEELPEGVPVPTKRRDCCGIDCNLF